MFGEFDERLCLSVAAVALYLSGAPRTTTLPWGRWGNVERALRIDLPRVSDISPCLRDHGLTEEASAMEERGLLAWADLQIRQQRTLSIADEDYPRRWRLTSAPFPAMWRRGRIQSDPGTAIILGESSQGRSIKAARACVFATENPILVGDCPLLGQIFSPDTDSVIQITASGLDVHCSRQPCLSPAPPLQGPCARFAAIRDHLILSAAERVLVFGASFRVGEAWNSAIGALRMRELPVYVFDDGSQASRALTALGALPFRDIAMKKAPASVLNALPLNRASAFAPLLP